MNKFYALIAAMAFAMSASAAAPELLFNDQPVTADGNYVTGYTTEDIGGFYLFLQDSGLSIRGEKGQTVTVKISASQSVQYCGLDGQCAMVQEGSKTVVLGRATGATIDGNIATAHLEIHNEDYGMSPQPDGMKDITLNVEAYYEGSTDKATVSVLMSNRPQSEIGGVADVAADNVMVTYTRGNIFNYTVAKPSKLSLYSVNGGLVLSQLVSATGSVSLDSLHPGVYIYSLAGKTGKILVRK